MTCNTFPIRTVTPVRKVYPRPIFLTLKQKREIVFRYVCDMLAVHEEAAKSKTRKEEPTLARHAYYYLCYHWKLGSYEALGTSMGMDYDHTTVLHGVHKIKDQIHIGYEKVDWVQPVLEKGFNSLR